MAKFKFPLEPPSEEERESVCPLLFAQNVIAGRWKIIILWYLSQQIRRFNELQRLLPNISKGILTRQLRELEDDGLVHREVYKEVPPKVEYWLTSKGKSFIPVLDMMGKWGKEYMDRKEPNSSLQS